MRRQRVIEVLLLLGVLLTLADAVVAPTVHAVVVAVVAVAIASALIVGLRRAST